MIKSLKSRFVLTSAVLFVLALAAVLSVSINRFNNFSQTAMQARVEAAANGIRTLSEDTRRLTVELGLHIAADNRVITAVLDEDMPELLRLFNQAQTENNVTFISALNADGTTIASSGEQELFQVPVCSTAPIIHESEIVGSVIVGVAMDTEAFVDRLQAMYDAEIVIFAGDTGDKSVASTFRKDGGGRGVGPGFELDSPSVVETVLTWRREMFAVVDIRGDIFSAFYLPLRDVSGEVFATMFFGINNSDIIREKNTMILLMIIAGFVGIIIALSVIFITSGRISKPLVQSAESLRQVSTRLEAGVGQVNDSASSVADSGGEQAAAVEETSATMNETSSMIASNVENTRTAEQLAASCAEISNETGKSMTNMLAAMDELKISSGTVSKIAKTLDDIAFQTNLLAINATVEAARAGGDAGRSFGVVAEEVRTLAQKSAKASAEAAEIIENNIKLTDASKTSAERVLSLAEQHADYTVKLGGLIAEIHAASEEQANGVQQVNIAMSQIEKSAQSNAAASEESAASAAMLRELVHDLENIYNGVNSVVCGGLRK